MNPRITELVEYLRSSREGLGAAIAAVPAVRHSERPAPDRWSVNEIVEHLALVERSVSKVFAKWLAEARANGLAPEGETSPLLEKMRMDHVVARTRRIEAPERVAPTQNRPVSESLAAIDESRAALIASAESADGLALGSIVHPHQALGPLTLYEWLGFAAAHMERHIDQIDEVRATLP
jgi:hypothetical protein